MRLIWVAWDEADHPPRAGSLSRLATASSGANMARSSCTPKALRLLASHNRDYALHLDTIETVAHRGKSSLLPSIASGQRSGLWQSSYASALLTSVPTTSSVRLQNPSSSSTVRRQGRYMRLQEPPSLSGHAEAHDHCPYGGFEGEQELEEVDV